jgi:hypothetical protein
MYMSIKLYTVSESKRILHAPKIEHTATTLIAAHSLMQACERDPEVTFEDMLRCLDYGGAIATVGARCLYVRTGRDGLGWQPGPPKDKPYVTDRSDWEAYLYEHFPKATSPGPN